MGLLALHCTAAGDDERALKHHFRAGQAARAINSPEEAVGHLDSAMEAAERLGLTPSDRIVREVLLHRGALIYDLGRDSPAAIQDVETAADAAKRDGDTELELDACMSLGGLWRSLDFPRGLEHYERAIELAERLDDPARGDHRPVAHGDLPRQRAPPPPRG